MSAIRKERLLREALGERGEMPAAEGIFSLAAIVSVLMAIVLFAG